MTININTLSGIIKVNETFSINPLKRSVKSNMAKLKNEKRLDKKRTNRSLNYPRSTGSCAIYEIIEEFNAEYVDYLLEIIIDKESIFFRWNYGTKPSLAPIN